MTQVTCSACTSTLRAKPELAGKRVKCPKCHAPISVPNSIINSDEANQDTSPAVPGWLILGASVLISLAVGGALAL